MFHIYLCRYVNNYNNSNNYFQLLLPHEIQMSAHKKWKIKLQFARIDGPASFALWENAKIYENKMIETRETQRTRSGAPVSKRPRWGE